MKKIFFALLVIFTTLFFVSCQKSTDSPSSPADIKGTWTFVSMSATTNTTAEATQSGESDKSVTTSSYTTENNTGTMTIDASTMTSNNISYTVNTTAKAYMYQNNVLIDSLEVPFNFTAPPSSGSVNYRFVTSDSIYSDQGSLFMNGVTQNTIPSGARIKLENDILYLTQTVHQVIEQNNSGIAVKTDESGVVVIKLKRQ